jgi:hypothetical protein
VLVGDELYDSRDGSPCDSRDGSPCQLFIP